MPPNFTHIPMRGFGTFQPDPKAYPENSVKESVLAALCLGYRHIDTAFAYGNGDVEKRVGEAVRESGIERSSIFIVSKLHNTFHEPKDVEVGLDMSLKNLEMDYVDLYLMHNPYAYAHDEKYNTVRKSDGSDKPLIDIEWSKRYPETWISMSDLVANGKAKAVGVSNFNVMKLKRLIRETGIVPACNQVEFNPYFPQKRLYEFCKLHGIHVVAHCPLGGSLAPAVAGRKGQGPLGDPSIVKIAEKNGKTPAQVILAWLLGRGVCVIPKSNRTARIAENFDCEFLLTESEDQVIANLMGVDGENGVRNLDSQHHIGFDAYDEEVDQPI